VSHKIYLLPGDGVGPEVVREGVKIMEAAEGAFGLSFEFIEVPGGALYYKEHGKDWPDGSFERLRDDSDAIVLGAVGWPGIVKPDGALAGGSLVLGVRFGLDLYANVRPTKLYPGVRHKIHDGFKQVWEPGKVDFVIVRENTEDLYSNTHGHLTRGGVTEVATDVRLITRKGSDRVIRFAFEVAKKRNGAISDGKRRVTCVDKSNVMRGCQLFRQVYDEVAALYPSVEKDYAYIDAFQQWLVRQPEFYDVAVTSNMMGDIATDLAAVLQGGMGMAASGNIGDRHAMFEPIHGSAPKHAGQDKVNPMATALAVMQLFDYLADKKGGKAYHAAAVAVEQAVATVLREGRVLTYDLGGTAKCSEVGTEIAACLVAVK
jgi:isocitrate/isopropylmalate dehydrogenase